MMLSEHRSLLVLTLILSVRGQESEKSGRRVERPLIMRE